MKIIPVVLLTAVLSSCSLIIPKRIPKDVKVEENKYIAVGPGSEVKELYRWPNDEYHTQLFNDWWKQARYMGTNSLLPYTFICKFHFSRDLSIEFYDDNFIKFVYRGKESGSGDPNFFRNAKAQDKALLRECIRIAKTAKKINKEPLEEYTIESKYWND